MGNDSKILRFITRHGLTFVGAFLVLWLGSSCAMLVFEQDAPGATITDLPHAIWWGIVTLLTVGYGDHVPITLGGRVVAVILMCGSVALFAFGIAVAYVSYVLYKR